MTSLKSIFFIIGNPKFLEERGSFVGRKLCFGVGEGEIVKESGRSRSIFLIFKKIVYFCFGRTKHENACHFAVSCWFCLFVFALLVILSFSLLLFLGGLDAVGRMLYVEHQPMRQEK